MWLTIYRRLVVDGDVWEEIFPLDITVWQVGSNGVNVDKEWLIALSELGLQMVP